MVMMEVVDLPPSKALIPEPIDFYSQINASNFVDRDIAELLLNTRAYYSAIFILCTVTVGFMLYPILSNKKLTRRLDSEYLTNRIKSSNLQREYFNYYYIKHFRVELYSTAIDSTYSTVTSSIFPCIDTLWKFDMYVNIRVDHFRYHISLYIRNCYMRLNHPFHISQSSVKRSLNCLGQWQASNLNIPPFELLEMVKMVLNLCNNIKKEAHSSIDLKYHHHLVTSSESDTCTQSLDAGDGMLSSEYSIEVNLRTHNIQMKKNYHAPHRREIKGPPWEQIDGFQRKIQMTYICNEKRRYAASDTSSEYSHYSLIFTNPLKLYDIDTL